MKTSAKDCVKQHRKALRAAGLRPVEIWVPDTRNAGFAAECRRQSRNVVSSGEEVAAQQWLQRMADTDGWR